MYRYLYTVHTHIEISSSISLLSQSLYPFFRMSHCSTNQVQDNFLNIKHLSLQAATVDFSIYHGHAKLLKHRIGSDELMYLLCVSQDFKGYLWLIASDRLDVN